ncbi:MAG TPA: FtsX-like permease family protein [Streptosporangiaceae bacterium]|nr:FtsX-like permease family protein [Streptosporangiaceae bacterium]
MGRAALIVRLIARDLQRRPAQAALLLLVIMAATTTLTLGLALYGATSRPYQQTRAATAGPDVVASYTDLPPMPRGATPAAALTGMAALARAPGVTGVSGPFPVGWATLHAGKLTAGVIAEGRALGRAAVDQPKLIAGSWVSVGGVVLERSFAAALGARVGEHITLDGRPFRVAGIAVTAATAPYPSADYTLAGTPFPSNECGMVWVTEAAARSFATSTLPLSYLLNLRLTSASLAPAFAQAHSAGEFESLQVLPWQQIAQQDNNLILTEQRALIVASWLLGLLAVASVAVIVGGQLAEQTRRIGLLKAIGGTPRLVALVLLGQNLLLALAAAAAGLGAGWLAAPLLTSPGSGLVGAPGAPSLTFSTVGWVAAVALAVAMLATLVPALRAARTSTVGALADAARPPRRRGPLVALSRRLPVPLLLGLRLVARRPRRSILSGLTICITATTIVAVLTVRAHQAQVGADNGTSARLSALANPRYERIDQVLLVLTVILILLAAVDALFITQVTAADARHSGGLVRALGATNEQFAAALSAAQLIPAVPAVLIGIPAGIGLVGAVAHGGTTTVPPAWWLAVMAAGVLVALAALVAIPAWAAARRPPAEILAAESVTG